MKKLDLYHFTHQDITKHNQDQIAIQIQELYKHLWKDNSSTKIQNRFHLYGNPKMSVITLGNEIIGFGLFHIVTLVSQEVMFRAGAVIHPSHRSKGLYGEMVTSCLNQYQNIHTLVCVRTRSLHVYNTMQNVKNSIPNAEIYPDLKKNNVLPKKIQEIMHYFSGSENKEHLPIVPHVYTKKMNNKLATHFNLGKQDAMMIIVKAHS